MLTDAAKRRISSYLVMLVFFLYKASESLLQPSIRIFIYQQVCVGEGIPPPVCDSQQPGDWHSIGRRRMTSKEENDLQRKASNYLLAYRILLNLPAVFFCLFAGSWSDRVGRKYPMMLPPLGAVLAVGCFAVGSAVGGAATLVWVMVGATVYGFFGKSTVMTMACSSYVADTSSREDRTELLGRLLAMNFFGIFLGSLFTGVFQSFGSVHSMLIVILVVNLVLELIIVLLVVESVESSDDAGCLQLACPCVNTATRSLSVRDSIGFLLQRRPQQLMLVFLFVSLCVNQICKQGEQDVILLLVEHAPFNWPGQYYGYYLSVYYACMGLNLVLILPLLTRFMKPRDSVLVMVGLLMKIIRLVITSLAQKTWLLFASAVLGCFAGFIVSVTKSMTSKLVDEAEIGQTFSLLSCAEALANLIGPALFTPIYAATVDMFPGMVFSLDAGVHFLLLCCFLKIYLTGDDSDETIQAINAVGGGDSSVAYDGCSADVTGELTPIAGAERGKPSISVHKVRQRSAAAAGEANDGAEYDGP
ncbi:hypothetical protein BOX15_Mlig026801g1 [Macrostomum lignano]|uniref:MFS domain-containing protein n=1 Tax=Macrostomum lignano TaxID=282301 RepID=A0A267EJV0_9PLAT|nr:hypothetical protein BOX15_Mlig026801g1 [Macrostomum lignano]